MSVLDGEVALTEASVMLDRGAWELVAVPVRKLHRQARENGWLLLQPLAPLLRGRALLGAGRTARALTELDRAASEADHVGADGTATLAEAIRHQARLLRGEEPPMMHRHGADPEVDAIETENRGLVAIRAGAARHAAALFGAAGTIMAEHGQSVWLARAHVFRAEALRVAGDRRAAAASERRARTILDGLGTPAAARRSIVTPLEELLGRS
jgi:hypothetical protein